MGIVLVVEDEAAVQEVLRAALRRSGFDVEVAGTAKEALAICSRRGREIDLLIADVRIPLGSGTEAAVQLRRRSPRVPVLFISGTDIEFWTESDRANVAELAHGSFSFLQKPFTCWKLMDSIRELLPPLALPRTA